MNFDGIGGGSCSSDLVLELVALDDGVGARDGVAAGGAEVEGARVPLRVPVHAAEGGAAAAREPRQAHALPAAGAPAGLGACSRGRRRRRRLGLGRDGGRAGDRRGGRLLEGRRGGSGGGTCRRRACRLLLLVQVAVALGAEVQRRGAAEEAAVVGAQAVALLPPLLLLLLLRHGRRTEPREREGCVGVLGGGTGSAGRKGLKRRSVKWPKGGEWGDRFGFRFKGREGIATTVRQVDRGVTAMPTPAKVGWLLRRGER